MRATPRGRQGYRPALERLEERDCPAFNIYYYSPVLLIRGHPTAPFLQPGDGLQLTLTAGGLLHVHEVSGGATVFDYGTYAPPQNVDLQLDYTNADVTFDLGGGRLPSNVLV